MSSKTEQATTLEELESLIADVGLGSNSFEMIIKQPAVKTLVGGFAHNFACHHVAQSADQWRDTVINDLWEQMNDGRVLVGSSDTFVVGILTLSAPFTVYITTVPSLQSTYLMPASSC